MFESDDSFGEFEWNVENKIYLVLAFIFALLFRQ